MHSICGCNVGDEGDDDDTANTTSSSINMDNMETEGILACDTDVSHQNRTDVMDLAKTS